MEATAETGHLLIADLTGYTAYPASGGLEHALPIAGVVLETVVGRAVPPVRLIGGDAASLLVEDGLADASLLVDAIEAAYVAFQRRLLSIDQATSGDCSLAPHLDLNRWSGYHAEDNGPRPTTAGEGSVKEADA